MRLLAQWMREGALSKPTGLNLMHSHASEIKLIYSELDLACR